MNSQRLTQREKHRHKEQNDRCRVQEHAADQKQNIQKQRNDIFVAGDREEELDHLLIDVFKLQNPTEQTRRYNDC